MKTTLINIGFGNAVVAERVIAVITPQSASGKRIREEAKENSLLIDATQGRKTRAIVI
ncbi:MAG TPA: extracellular matrix/biofilm biosynthesis regulator RemA family protein, partial [Spirochaetota bacterium]